MKERKRRTVRRLDDLAKHKAELMIRFGGFSYRFIAQQVFGIDVGEDSDEAFLARGALMGFARRRKLKVTDWRNGISLPAQQHVRELLRIRKTFEQQLKQTRKKRKAG